MYLKINFAMSTPLPKRKHNITLSNSKQQVDDFVKDLDF